MNVGGELVGKQNAVFRSRKGQGKVMQRIRSQYIAYVYEIVK